jgi:hypothetical protein
VDWATDTLTRVEPRCNREGPEGDHLGPFACVRVPRRRAAGATARLFISVRVRARVPDHLCARARDACACADTRMAARLGPQGGSSETAASGSPLRFFCQNIGLLCLLVAGWPRFVQRTSHQT